MVADIERGPIVGNLQAARILRVEKGLPRVRAGGPLRVRSSRMGKVCFDAGGVPHSNLMAEVDRRAKERSQIIDRSLCAAQMFPGGFHDVR